MEGIEELKQVLKMVAGLGNAVDKALEDNKIKMSDAPLFMGVFLDMPSAFEGIDKVPGEIKDLDESESAELVKYVEEELDLRSDRTEEIIEKGLKLASDVYAYSKLFKKEEV